MVDCNVAALRMLGFTRPEELIGRHPSVFSPELQSDGEPSRQKADRILNEVAASGKARFEWLHRRADGSEILVEVSLNQVVVNDRPLVLVDWRDLTESKRQHAQLLQSTKLAGLGEMASGLAHEINNPLAIIQAKAEQLELKLRREGKVTQEWGLEKVSVIHDTIDRIASIVRGLKNFARDSTGEPMIPTEVRKILTDTLSFCAARFRSHYVTLEVPRPGRPILVNCRSVQISQVILNLLNNAFDAVVDAEERWVRLEIDEDATHVLIACVDSGPGIPAAVRDKIMQPFFTTKPVGKGTGLGFSISSGIVASHGGALYLDDGSPHTRFVVRLPKAKTEDAP